MTQQQRLLLAIALSFGLTLAFTNFVTRPAAEAEAARLAALDAGATAEASADAGDGAGAVVAAAPGAAPAAGVPAPEARAEVALKTVQLDRPSMALSATNEGAGFTDAVLKGKRERAQQSLTIPEGYKKLFGGTFPPPPQMDLADPVPGGPPLLAVSIAGATPLPALTRYAVTTEEPGQLAFAATQGAYEVTKTFRWSAAAGTSETDPQGYLSTLEVTVKNISAAPVAGELVVHLGRAIDPGSEQSGSMFGGIGNESSVVCRVADDVQRKKSNPDKPLEEFKGAAHFVAIDQQYFLAAVWPAEGAAEGRCALTATPQARSAELAAPLALAPGQAVSRRFGVFLGPKDLALLQAVAKAPGVTSDPGLEKTVDFGIWAVICKLLIVVMRLSFGLAGNWGLAIILLTVLVKVALLPLTHKAMVSAEQMKKLQPRMEELRKRFPDDKEKQNMEMMKLYQEAKVNPLGGCLPLLLQLPIWAALFQTLRTSYELYGEPFFGVWSDLTSKDPTYLLPLALGITMIVTQRLQPQMTMDKSQAFLMTWVMPVFFSAIMMNYPAGLALYIFTNNLLSIVQQFGLRRWLQRTGQAAPKAQPKGAAR
jgi:YidC/Oxa1 family membrane protein insertase